MEHAVRERRARAGRAGRGLPGRPAGRAPRAGRRSRGARRPGEEVASVERPRDRVERVRRIRELVRGVDPARSRPAGGGRCPGRRTAGRPRLGARAAAAARRHRGRRREVDADGHVRRSCSRARARPASTTCGGIPCVMSMICASGAIRLITPWQVPTKSSFSPKSLRNVMNTPRSVTPRRRAELLAARPARRAAAHRAPTRLAAQAHAARPDPDEGGRRLKRQGSRHHERSICICAAGHASALDLARASSASSAVSRSSRASFAAMIAT